MKKIIATALCLTLGAPCFAMGPMGPAPTRPMTHNSAPHHMIPPPKPHHTSIHVTPHHRHHMSAGAKTAVAVAGVAGLAMLVAAIAD